VENARANAQVAEKLDKNEQKLNKIEQKCMLFEQRLEEMGGF